MGVGLYSCPFSGPGYIKRILNEKGTKDMGPAPNQPVMGNVDERQSPVRETALTRMATLGKEAVLLLCVLENFLLAIFNNAVSPIGPQTVVVIQLALTLCVVALSLPTVRIGKGFILLLMALMFIFCCATIVNQSFNAKFIYDLFLIPIFIVFGSSLKRFNMRVIFIITSLAFLVALIELFVPQVYTIIVNPLKYYTNTRIWVEQMLAQGRLPIAEYGLYVGVNRPSGNLLHFLGAEHRLSSIFLDPLTFGYFAVLISLVFINYYRNLIAHQIVAVSLCILMAGLSDTRVAVFLILVLFAVDKCAPRLPNVAGVFAALGLFISCYIFYLFVASDRSGDLSYRLSLTFEPIGSADFKELVFGGLDVMRFSDSGILYIISNAGVIGLFLFMCASVGLLGLRYMTSRIWLPMMIFEFVTLCFGGAVLSIKTAPILGAFIGAWGAGVFMARGQLEAGALAVRSAQSPNKLSFFRRGRHRLRVGQLGS